MAYFRDGFQRIVTTLIRLGCFIDSALDGSSFTIDICPKYLGFDEAATMYYWSSAKRTLLFEKMRAAKTSLPAWSAKFAFRTR